MNTIRRDGVRAAAHNDSRRCRACTPYIGVAARCGKQGSSRSANIRTTQYNGLWEGMNDNQDVGRSRTAVRISDGDGVSTACRDSGRGGCCAVAPSVAAAARCGKRTALTFAKNRPACDGSRRTWADFFFDPTCFACIESTADDADTPPKPSGLGDWTWVKRYVGSRTDSTKIICTAAHGVRVGGEYPHIL